MKNQLDKSTTENLVKIIANVKTASESLETNLMLFKFKELSDNLTSTLANINFPPKISLPQIDINIFKSLTSNLNQYTLPSLQTALLKPLPPEFFEQFNNLTTSLTKLDLVTNHLPNIDLSNQVNVYAHKSPDYGSQVISVDVKRRVYTICGESLYKALASDEKTVSISATFQND